MRSCVAGLAFLWFALAAPAHAVTAAISPEAPIAEPVTGGQAFNFDIVVRNDESEAIELMRVVVEAFDASGASIMRRQLDGAGAAPSIETVANRRLAPGEERLYFNPFPLVPQDARVARWRVELHFVSVEDRNRSFDASAEALVSRRTASVLTLPLSGRVRVWDGHDVLAHHRRWDYTLGFLRGLGFEPVNGMRYAYDFVLVDEAGRLNDGDPARNESWFTFGAPVRAPADGVVVRAVESHADDSSFNPEDSRTDINALFGNYIVIDHGDGVFSLIGHLKQESITVAVGARVRAGDVVAAAGASGSAEFPHIHYQLMYGPSMDAEGAPGLFRDFTRLRGERRIRVRQGPVETGETVEAR